MLHVLYKYSGGIQVQFQQARSTSKTAVIHEVTHAHVFNSIYSFTVRRKDSTSDRSSCSSTQLVVVHTFKMIPIKKDDGRKSLEFKGIINVPFTLRYGTSRLNHCKYRMHSLRLSVSANAYVSLIVHSGISLWATMERGNGLETPMQTAASSVLWSFVYIGCTSMCEGMLSPTNGYLIANNSYN